MRWAPIIIDLVGFKICWIVTVATASTTWWWAGPATVALWFLIYLSTSPQPPREAALILIGALAGISWDCASVTLGLLRPAHADTLTWPFVAIFFALWVNFGTTLRICFRWCWRRLPVASVLGGIAGPVSYLLGEKLGAITLGDARWLALLVIAAEYALLFPAWLFAARVMLGEERSE